jgi:hypothetical protein
LRGNSKIHHGRQVVDVQAARCHVGGDQDGAARVLELDQHLVAIALFHVAVQRERVNTRLAKVGAHLAHQFLGIAEHHRCLRLEMRKQPDQRRQPVTLLAHEKNAGRYRVPCAMTPR